MAKFSYERKVVPKRRTENKATLSPIIEENGIQVIIASYNCAEYLQRCLFSVEKALKGYKWILLFGDDASDDNTQEIINNHKSSADQIVIKRFPKANNAAQAKNRVIQMGQPFNKDYPWICFMDADDAMGEKRISHLLPIAVSHGYKVVAGDHITYMGDPQPIYNTINERIQFNCRVGPWSTLIHKDLIPIDGILFPEDYDAYEDCVLFLQWYKKGIRMVPCPGEIVHHYYIRNDSVANPRLLVKKEETKHKYQLFKRAILAGTSIDLSPQMPPVVQLDIPDPVHEKIYSIDKTNLMPGDYHFNSSIIDFDGKLLLAYRWDQIDSKVAAWISHRSIDIVIVELDRLTLQPIKDTNKVLNIPTLYEADNGHYKFEDPRLFVFKNELYCMYITASLPLQTDKKPCASVGICKLNNKYDVVNNWLLPYGNNLQSDGSPLKSICYLPKGNEKNWSFFEYENDLYLIYSINPHKVLKVDLSNSTLKEVGDTTFYPEWRHGELRGGSCPIKVNDEYFGFFHSSFRYKNDKIFPHPIYVMGMYGFEAKPPFKVTKISKAPILFGDIHGHIWSTAVVFPCGAIYDKGKWLVSYGYNDYASKIVEIKHEKLINNCQKFNETNICNRPTTLRLDTCTACS